MGRIVAHFDLTGNPDVPPTILEPQVWDTPGWNPHRADLREIRLKTKFSREFLADMAGISQPYIADMKTEFRAKASRTQKHVGGFLKFGYSVLMPSLPETVNIMKNICDISVTGDSHTDPAHQQVGVAN